MCERKIRKMKKGSDLMMMRERRRMHRTQWLLDPPPAPATAHTHVIDKQAQCRLIFKLALKTISLMHNNNVIQQKIISLRKETSEFVASVMNNPENKQRYLDRVHLHWPVQEVNAHLPVDVQHSHHRLLLK